MDDHEAGVVQVNLVQELGAAVRRSVIHENALERDVVRVHGRGHGGLKVAEVLHLVVDGDDEGDRLLSGHFGHVPAL